MQLGRASLIAEDDVLAPTLRDDDHSTVPAVVRPCSRLLDETMLDQPSLIEKHIANALALKVVLVRATTVQAHVREDDRVFSGGVPVDGGEHRIQWQTGFQDRHQSILHVLSCIGIGLHCQQDAAWILCDRMRNADIEHRGFACASRHDQHLLAHSIVSEILQWLEQPRR